jgi:hypothetical protein
MSAPREYEGHRSWACWNVALYIANDYATYQEAVRLMRQYKGNSQRCASILRRSLPARTPDGARYSQLAVRLALEGLEVQL